MKKKEKEKQDFYRCKSNCVCNKEKCLAAGLKECPSCHSILRSVCSKAACKMDGKKPDMILAAATLKKGASKKLKYHTKGNYSSEEEESDDASLESFDESESDTDLVDESDMTMEIPEKDKSQSAPAVSQLQHVWKSLESSTPEDQIVGKWYGVVYPGKKSMVLYVAKVLRRFLVDVDGPVDTILMRCLKSKSGFGTRLQATPEHLPPDDTHFKLEDFIAGPLDVIPVGRSSTDFEVPKYNNLKNHFDAVKNMDRKQLLLSLH